MGRKAKALRRRKGENFRQGRLANVEVNATRWEMMNRLRLEYDL